MKQIHVECNPDETLVLKLGFGKRNITHHQGRSRIFNALTRVSGHLAMVDEDPGCARSDYENSLRLVEESDFTRCYTDCSNNTIVVLKGKLEDYIINTCRKHHIDITGFGLPDNAKNLHGVINNKLSNFMKLANYLIREGNPELVQLKRHLR